MNEQQSFGESRLSNPTAYHLQQMRFKESTIDPAQMLENNTIFVGRQQQQQQQESPNLSDIDYSELAAGNQMNNEFRAYRSDIGFGDQQMDNNNYPNYAMPMKRSSTQVGSLGGSSGGQAMYYPHQSFEQSRMKPFAGSAPSHMGYMYSPFAGSDDVSVSSHSNFTQNNKDPDYDDDYSNQAK